MDVTDTPPDALDKPPRAPRLGKFERRKNPRVRRRSNRIDRILLLLAAYRMLTRTQLAELLSYEGYSEQHTGRLISDLYDLRMVDKPEAQQRFQARMGRGTLPDVLALGDQGAAYLETHFGIPRSAARWRDKNRDVKAGHIAHTLDTAAVMLAFERASILRGDVRLIYPGEILAGAALSVQRERKPFEWRVETAWQGTKLTIPVGPDYPFGLEFLRCPPGRNRLWFTLEADEGSETVVPENRKKVKTCLFHKYVGYEGTRQQKLQTTRYGWGGFRVITVTKKHGVQVSRDPETGELVRRTRVENLQAAARLAAPDARPGFFLFADLTSLKRHDDVLTMPWKSLDPAKTFVLELKP